MSIARREESAVDLEGWGARAVPVVPLVEAVEDGGPGWAAPLADVFGDRQQLAGAIFLFVSSLSQLAGGAAAEAAIAAAAAAVAAAVRP